MILCKSPMRVSLAGGFADVAARYRGERYQVLSVTIRLYASILVAVERDGGVVASYSRIERVERAEHLQNVLFRAALAECAVESGIQVHSVASVPLSAGGLGGSGAACVSLVNALYRLRSVSLAEKVLAEMACRIEIDRLGRKIGKQDQYAAAYGGLNCLTFDGNDVDVEQLDFAAVREMLEDRCLLIPCLGPDDAPKRDAGALLTEQLASKSDAVKRLSELVQTTVYALDTRDMPRLIACVNAGWDAKRTLSPSLSTTASDMAIDEVRRSGGGAKLCGAGGGGYVFALFPSRETLVEFVAGHADSGAFEIGFESSGSTIAYDDWERIGGPPARMEVK